MEAFRKVIKGWLGKVLLVLFLTPLALVGIEGYFSGGNSADTAKTVNGQSISNQELEKLMASLKEQYLAYTQGDETLLNTQFIENKALESLIARTLLAQQADKLGISLAYGQMEQMIAQQPSLQENGQFSPTLYENYLRSVGLTSDALIANLRQDHALQMLSSSIADNTLVGPVEIQQIANLQSEKRTVHIASIPLDQEKMQVKVTDQEIQAYFDAHKTQFKQVAHIDVDYVVLKPTQVNTQINQVTEQELQTAYQKFIEEQKTNQPAQVKHILITTESRTDAEAKKLAEQIYAEIQKGKTFADAATQYSEDPSSKQTGGLIEGYVTGVFGQTFDQAVDTLATGQTSQAVKTQYGYHLIQAQKQALQLPSFEDEKARLTQMVQKTKNDNSFADLVNQLNELVVSSDALDVIAQEVKAAKIEAVNKLSLGMSHPVLSDPNVKAKLFNDDVKNGDRNVSTNIQLTNGDSVWVKVRDYHPSGEQTFAQAQPYVKAKLIEQKAATAAQAKIQAALDAFKTKPATEVLAQNSLKFENLGTFARSQGLLKRDLERTAFSLAQPKEGMWSVGTTTLTNELIVVAVSAVQKPTTDLLNETERLELTRLYEQLRAQQELDDYTRYLKSQAKIK